MNKEILIINNNLNSGGAEKILQDVVAYLAAQGERVTVWSSNGDMQTFKEKYPASASFRKYPFWYVDCRRFSPKWFCSRACRLLYEKLLLKLKKWDVVAAFKEGEGMLFAAVPPADRKVAWVHTDYASFHWTEYLFADNEAERRCMAGFDAVAAVSSAAAKGVLDTVGDPGNLNTVYNPINYKAIEQKAALESPSRPEGKMLLVSVGRLCEVKRYDMLIDICNELSEIFPLELWIVGGGELEESLKAKISRENISCVKLLGKKDNPYPYIACADLLLSSSASESYGLTVQEALILGVPVFASYCPAIAESLDADFGFISAADKESFKSGLAELLAQPEKLSEYRRNIATRYDKNLLWKSRLEAIHKLLLG